VSAPVWEHLAIQVTKIHIGKCEVCLSDRVLLDPWEVCYECLFAEEEESDFDDDEFEDYGNVETMGTYF
jgi:hypothetical protein